MDRVAAYAELTRELARWKALDYSLLCEQIGAQPSVCACQHRGEDFIIEVRVLLAPEDQQSLRIEASAFATNWFANDRVDECVIVTKPEI